MEQTSSKYTKRRAKADPAKPRKERKKKPKDMRLYEHKTAITELAADPQLFLPTIAAYTDAFNQAAKAGYPAKVSSNVSLHNLIYEQLRNSSPLSSQLICSSIKKATEALKAGFEKDKKHGKTSSKKSGCPHSKFCAVRYDDRSFSLKLNERLVSLTTINGRIEVPFFFAAYYDEYFDREQGWRYASADLVYHPEKPNRIFLHITFKRLAKVVEFSGNVYAADSGVYNLLTVSKVEESGKVSKVKFYGSRKLKEVKDRYKRLKAELQKVGTKSAKRHLVKVKDKERRFVADTNHCVSKAVVAALRPGDVLVLEDLTGLKEKKVKKGGYAAARKFNAMIAGWSYFEERQFLTYKSIGKGAKTLLVSPAWSSATCPECGHCEVDNRSGHKFCCKKCGYKANADFVAVRNLAAKGWSAIRSSNQVDVNLPNDAANVAASMSGSAAEAQMAPRTSPSQIS
jgi:putative transposase